MAERHITEGDIVSTISNPDKVVSQSEEKFQAVKLIKKSDKKYLIVAVYRQTNSVKRVITTFLTTKVKKYLK
jgi:hypothetical protein